MSDSGDRGSGIENGDKPSLLERALSKLGLARKKSIRTDLED